MADVKIKKLLILAGSPYSESLKIKLLSFMHRLFILLRPDASKDDAVRNREDEVSNISMIDNDILRSCTSHRMYTAHI